MEDFFPEVKGYAVLRPLGHGGMGSVFLAREEALDRLVAIKVVGPGIKRDEAASARFQREARAMATVEHSGVARLYSYGYAGEHPYLVMEFVEGESLADRLRRLGRFAPAEALGLLRQIVEALAAAWEKGIVHRDMKPANVLIDGKGRVRVVDFGLAKNAAESAQSLITTAGLVVGTPEYLSPEQALGEEVDFRSDLYSVGLILYEMLVGERPFRATPGMAVLRQHLLTPLPRICDRIPSCPPATASLCDWLTSKEPQGRPSSHAELLRRIDAAAAALAGEPALSVTDAPTCLPENPTSVPRPRRGRWRVLAAALALAACSAAATAALILIYFRAPGGGLAAPRSVLAPTLLVRNFQPLAPAAGGTTYTLRAQLTSDIIMHLARKPGIRVLSEDTAARARDDGAVEPSGATDMELRGVVEIEGDEVVVRCQLVDARTGQFLWAERYERSGADELETKDDLANVIASAAVSAAVPEVAAAGASDPRQSGAGRLYLKAREHLARRTAPETEAAIQLFAEAVRREPKNALAHAGLADAYVIKFVHYGAAKSWLEDALRAATTALELEPDSPEVNRAAGQVFLAMGRVSDAARLLRRARELNPRYVPVMGSLAATYLQLGEFDDAMKYALEAVKVAPQDSKSYLIVSEVLRNAGQEDAAASWRHRALEIDPELAPPADARSAVRARNARAAHPGAPAVAADGDALDAADNDGAPELAYRCLLDGDLAKARSLLVTAAEAPPRRAQSSGVLTSTISAYVEMRDGNEQAAQDLLAASEAVNRGEIGAGTEAWAPYYDLAVVASLQDRPSDACAALYEAVRRGWRLAWLARQDPMLAAARSEPRCAALLDSAAELVASQDLDERLPDMPEAAKTPETPDPAPSEPPATTP
ncbi:MAG: protein kinase [Candidatus Schekmanbacteria bacterium]|nr:protein kinase [Candidatus Schekmanbacteria bacterium]